jgi:hypothetical protein
MNSNGTEVVERITDIPTGPSPPISRVRRQGYNFPPGTSPTCTDSTFKASDLYDGAWGEVWSECPEWDDGIVGWGFSRTYGTCTAYFCSYEAAFQDIKRDQAEWGTAVGDIAAQCTNAVSGQLQSGKE